MTAAGSQTEGRFTMDERRSDSPELDLNRLLVIDAPFKIAVAESCTGGAVAARIVSIAGSSDYFLGGIVSYSNDAKHQLLGVSTEILETRGAVSAECAVAMADGECVPSHRRQIAETAGFR